MAAGPIGSVWHSGSWTDTSWTASTWAAVAVVVVSTFVAIYDAIIHRRR